MIQMSLFTKQKFTDLENKLMVTKVERWESESVWFFATPWTVIHGILQARILDWLAFPFSRGSSHQWDWTQVSHTACGFFTSWATRESQEYWSG